MVGVVERLWPASGLPLYVWEAAAAGTSLREEIGWGGGGRPGSNPDPAQFGTVQMWRWVCLACDIAMDVYTELNVGVETE